jgi:hypothetical protein
MKLAESRTLLAACFVGLTFNGLHGVMSQKIQLFMDRCLPNNLCIDKTAQKVRKFVYDAAERRKAYSVVFLTRYILKHETLIDASKEVGLEVTREN